MSNDHTPAWMVTLIVLFGITTAAGIIGFVVFHAQHEVIQENLATVTNTVRNELQPRAEQLQRSIPRQEERLQLGRAKLLEIRNSDEDMRSAITGTLAPAHDTTLATIESKLKERERKLRDLLDRVAAARADLANQEEVALVNECNAVEERLELREKVQERSQELESFKREQRDELLVLEKAVDDRRKRVEELLDRRDITADQMVSDGQILQATVTDGFVIINRGMDHDLRENTRFVVYNRRGGAHVVKGAIEVISVEARLATARVLSEVDENDPIIPGDHLHHAIYNPHETKIYVIAGHFERYSVEELKRFIRESGGEVEDEMTARTHFLVAGKDADVALEEASLNGVTILSENQLLDMVRSRERYRVRQGMVFAISGDFGDVDRSVIERFVRGNGGVLRSEITDDTQVLIAGDNAAEAISRARLQGATIINQDQLTHLMGSDATDFVE